MIIKEYVNYVGKFLGSDKVAGWTVFTDLLHLCALKK